MRMPNGYGSIIKLKGNRRKPYQVRLTKEFTAEGKQKYKCLGYFSKFEDAMAALNEYNSNPYDIEANKITFREVYEKWSKHHFSKIGKSSIENYTNCYKRYCKELYEMRFKDIRVCHLQGIIDNSKKAYPTRKAILCLLSQLSKYALEHDIVDKTYTQYVDIGLPNKKKEKQPFSRDEIELLWEKKNEIEYVDTILIMIFSGMRIGELLDLKTENIHFDERYMIGGLKTKAGINRVIPIHEKIESLIKKYYNPQNEYLITTSNNKKMTYEIYRRRFDNIMEILGLKHNPHEARHTFASLMDSAGANKLCTKKILGHALEDFTEDVYIHKTVEELIAAVDLI